MISFNSCSAKTFLIAVTKSRFVATFLVASMLPIPMLVFGFLAKAAAPGVLVSFEFTLLLLMLLLLATDVARAYFTALPLSLKLSRLFAELSSEAFFVA